MENVGVYADKETLRNLSLQRKQKSQITNEDKIEEDSIRAQQDQEHDTICEEQKDTLLPILPGRECVQTISTETLKNVLEGEYNDKCDYVIIDCRFPYEFEGGHVINAKNLYTEEQIENYFFPSFNDQNIQQQSPATTTSTGGKRLAVIFHCEFSSKRGPFAWQKVRELDRGYNAWPTLQYPDIYLLDGGYKNFYKNNPSLCEGKSDVKYVSMLDKEFKPQLQLHRREENKRLLKRSQSMGCIWGTKKKQY